MTPVEGQGVNAYLLWVGTGEYQLVAMIELGQKSHVKIMRDVKPDRCVGEDGGGGAGEVVSSCVAGTATSEVEEP